MTLSNARSTASGLSGMISSRSWPIATFCEPPVLKRLGVFVAEISCKTDPTIEGHQGTVRFVP
jgi:hypothetical protein